METESSLSEMFKKVWPHLGEREKRLVAASEAKRIGRKGISMVSRACGLSRVTITKGIRELERPPLETGKTRRSGAGRPRVERSDPSLWSNLEKIVRETTSQNSNAPFIWSCKSTRSIAKELTDSKHRISHEKVAQILRKNGFNLQGTRKNDEGHVCPARESQFRQLGRIINLAMAENVPVLALETKRREKNCLCENNPECTCHRVPASTTGWSDLLASGNCPEGLYSLDPRQKCVTLETRYEALTLTANTIIGWWKREGQFTFSTASRILLTVDGSCYKSALWKIELQKISNEIGLPVEVGHFPPGTTRWNYPHHQLFAFGSSNWHGEAAKDLLTTVRLIGEIQPVATLSISARLDHRRFTNEISERSEELKSVNLSIAEYHGDCNYTVSPSFSTYTSQTIFNQPGLSIN